MWVAIVSRVRRLRGAAIVDISDSGVTTGSWTKGRSASAAINRPLQRRAATEAGSKVRASTTWTSRVWQPCEWGTREGLEVVGRESAPVPRPLCASPSLVMIIGRGWDQWFHRLTAQFQEFIYNSSARISYWDVDEGPRSDLRRNEVLKKLELICSTGCVVGLAVFLPTANRLPPTTVDLETQRFVSPSQQNWRLATCVAAVRHGRPGAPVFVCGRASLTELNTSHLRDVLTDRGKARER